MFNLSILGAQWGDEGKGKIIDLITDKFDYVVRYQGGNNAGHTIIVGEKKIILRLIPSGVLREHVKCVLGNGVVVSPEALFTELEELNKININIKERVFISEACILIMPFHVLLDNYREDFLGDKSIGTTRRGISPAYEDKVARRALRMIDIFNIDILREKLKVLVDYYNSQYKIFNKPEISFNEMYQYILSYRDRLMPLITDVTILLEKARLANKKIAFEGAQGSLLDIDHGTYPYVTSSNTISGAIASGAGFAVNNLNYIMGVIKAYCTRVGNGPFTTELINDKVGEHLFTVGQEFGSVTKRRRRCGWFDACAVKRARIINGITGFCLTKLDVLDGLEEVKVCVAYQYPDGSVQDISPYSLELWELAKPIYKVFKGWKESTFGVTKFEDLPENAQIYVKELEKIIGSKISVLSTGPERNQTQILDEELAKIF